MHKLSAALLPALALALFADLGSREVEAGQVDVIDAGCANKDGVELCWGSLRGFRLSDNATASARFVAGYSGGVLSYRLFQAHFNGADYGCTIVPGSPADDAFAQLSVNPDLHFTIVKASDFSCELQMLSLESNLLP